MKAECSENILNSSSLKEATLLSCRFMYKEKTIAVVVPCYNEETQIGGVITTMPAIVDKVIVVNDKSTDNTLQVIQSMVHEGGKVVLVEHEKNQGVGGAIA
jgi:glycosyltransferase involved in cell wall biosynthesis